jgi:hypothetical protein
MKDVNVDILCSKMESSPATIAFRIHICSILKKEASNLTISMWP